MACLLLRMLRRPGEKKCVCSSSSFLPGGLQLPSLACTLPTLGSANGEVQRTAGIVSRIRSRQGSPRLPWMEEASSQHRARGTQ